ncbi:HD domain-containing protein [Candidatus Woesearchaeota archaeon]|nr:HD domain-containing protein [Candidatus Woesearchaeota archaeon]
MGYNEKRKRQKGMAERQKIEHCRVKMKIPTKKECYKLLKKYSVPLNVIRHSEDVCRVSLFIGERMKKRGEKINLKLLEAASLLHDIDKIHTLNNGRHGIMSCNILKKEGFNAVARFALIHVLHAILSARTMPKTWEEKIFYYADRRVNPEGIVSAKIRFDYLRQQYGAKDKKIMKMINEAEPKVKRLEKEIFSRMRMKPEEINKLTAAEQYGKRLLQNTWR